VIKVIKHDDVERLERSPGVYRRPLITKDEAESFWMIMWEIEPGFERHPRAHPGEHGAAVVSGKGIFRSGEKEIPIERGSIVFVSGGEEHAFINTGKEPLRYILVHTAFGEERRPATK